MSKHTEHQTDELRIDREMIRLDSREASMHAEQMVKALRDELPEGQRIRRVVMSLSVFVDDEPSAPPSEVPEQ